MKRKRDWDSRATRGMTVVEKLDFYSIPEPNSGCLLWLGHVTTSGYGDLRLNGRQNIAHRLSWETVNGPIPDGLFACHKCDVRTCINPAHLFLGTHQDNVDDQVMKQRQSFGVRNGRAKLSEAEVMEILSAVGTNIAVGEKYGVSDTVISYIRSGKAWGHLHAKAKLNGQTF